MFRFSQEFLSLFHHSDQFDFVMHRLSKRDIIRTELFMCFCIKKFIGTQGEVCQQLKIFLHPPVVCATDHSKAVVSVLFFFYVA